MAPNRTSDETKLPTRRERDALGEIDVPDHRLWGAQTQRSLDHFRISDERMPADLIAALATVKLVSARVNADLGLLKPAKATAIADAATEVLAGAHADDFPLVVWQTGSGTQTNMNLNEVLANRASELLGGPRGIGRLVHANDEVNLGQSSNDVFPTAMHVAAVLACSQRVLPALYQLQATLVDKVHDFAGIIKVGRTHLQDAVPLTLGQEFSGYAAQLAHAQVALTATQDALLELAIGGTAVGTGLNTHPEFGVRVANSLPTALACPSVGQPTPSPHWRPTTRWSQSTGRSRPSPRH